MSCNWPNVALGKYCSKIGSGATPKGGNSVYLDSGEITLIRSQNIYNEGFKSDGLVYITPEAAQKLKNVIIEPNDVLINITGDSVARVCLAPKEHLPARVNQHVAIIRVDPKEFDHRYLRYYLTSLKMQSYLLTIASSGATRNALTKSMLESLEVSKPPLDIQKKIGDVLEQFENKIQLNTQTNQTLEEMAQAIFKSWFVDFDPVKAKMNGEQPEGMDAATASLFPEKLVESELGLIPEGWEVTKLSKVIDLLNGFAFKSPDYVKEGTFVLRTKNFDSSNSVERLGDDVYLPDEFLESHKKYLCEAYDYHVVMVAASIGKTGMIYPHQLPALRNQNMWCFRPKNESLRFYTKYMVDGLVKLNMGLASGSARAFFKKGDFNSYEFALPSSELLTKFNDVVGNLVKQKGSLLNQNVQLAAMRDTLLPKLLSGEIELSAEL
ncbi:restriction endonuclease subunit S (plasmid) [Vibrio metschnikovii]|uniref:restriction endonuclease subunit S n=1 Tax=Vibrio metschnikovii TaxID=28172 RepID=UPI00333160AD|nr:restriction endonuclease subunit S [Vibrio metschnikovii]